MMEDEGVAHTHTSMHLSAFQSILIVNKKTERLVLT